MKNKIQFKVAAVFFLMIFSIIANAGVSFTSDKSGGCAPLTVNFTYTGTTGAKYLYRYYFGDGDSPLVASSNL